MQYKMLIDGEWVEGGNGNAWDVVNCDLKDWPNG